MEASLNKFCGVCSCSVMVNLGFERMTMLFRTPNTTPNTLAW